MKTKISKTAEKIGSLVTESYQKIEDSVVSGYRKVENGAVEGFGRVTDKCVDILFAREGETTEEAKARLSGRE